MGSIATASVERMKENVSSLERLQKEQNELEILNQLTLLDLSAQTIALKERYMIQASHRSYWQIY